MFLYTKSEPTELGKYVNYTLSDLANSTFLFFEIQLHSFYFFFQRNTAIYFCASIAWKKMLHARKTANVVKDNVLTDVVKLVYQKDNQEPSVTDMRIV